MSEQGFNVHIAGRTLWGDDESELRAGFGELFADIALGVDAANASELVIFPEMDVDLDVPEITTECWDILGKDPNDVMCASSRMVVKRKGRERPEVVSCTLLPYEEEFSLGETLRDSLRPVALNHPHCASFCVLGGGSCSS